MNAALALVIDHVGPQVLDQPRFVEPLFASEHAALTFAFNYSTEQYSPSALAQLMGPNIGNGKGLVGLDGAAQAGMILREVSGMDFNERGHLVSMRSSFIVVRFAPHALTCSCRAPCCSGLKRSPPWEEAVDKIAMQAISQLSGRLSNYRLRQGIVKRFYGESVTMSELAEKSHVNRDTASDHNGRICAWLRKEDNSAWHSVCETLKLAGIVG